MLPAYPLILATNSADGAALTGTTPTTILPPSAVATIPAGALQVGSLLKITLRGRFSTLTASPGTFTFDIRFGAVVISAFGALALNTTAQVNAWFEAVLTARIVTVGASTAATALCMGSFTSRANIGAPAVAAGAVTTAGMPDTAPAAGTGFDSTASQKVDVFGTWSVANAANTLQVHQAIVELKL